MCAENGVCLAFFDERLLCVRFILLSFVVYIEVEIIGLRQIMKRVM